MSRNPAKTCICLLAYTKTIIFILIFGPAPSSTLFPYTTLFRSKDATGAAIEAVADAAAKLSGWRDGGLAQLRRAFVPLDRKSTRLNSSHVEISYAVFRSKK